jgi:glycosyltransferase involved in cell wall biosynthesis
MTPKPIRVAIVAASPRWIGGQSVQANLLVRKWHNDPSLDVRFIPIDPIMPPWACWAERIPLLRTFARTPFYVAALWHGMNEVDIAHIFSASYWSFLLTPMPAWLIATIRGKATVIHYHSGEARDHLRRSGIAVRILRAAGRIVVPSEYLADVFREFNLQTQVVPNFVDTAQFSFRPRQLVRPRLVCTRGFHPYYSVDIVVRAFGLIKKDYPEARLCLVGGGPTEGEVEELVKQLGLADVEFAGPVSHAEIARYYDKNDIFINASWLDNMPVSILEAFASGNPVVTTAPDGIRYLVEHERTGLLCEPGDWRALAGNVIRLLREPTLSRRLSENAYEEVQNYLWKRVRSRWLEVYRSMCSLNDENEAELDQCPPTSRISQRIELGSR